MYIKYIFENVHVFFVKHNQYPTTHTRVQERLEERYFEVYTYDTTASI